MSFLLPLLASLPLLADPISVESDQLDYRGGTLHLEGHVHIVHPLGQLTAHEARLKEKGDRTFELHQRVELHFADGGHLSCWHAFLDPNTLQGRFAGALPLERVTYRESSLSLLCDRMDVALHLADPTAPVQGQLDAITARGRVQIDHGKNFRASADEVLYSRAGPSILPPHLSARYIVTRRVDQAPGLIPPQPKIADILRLRGNVELTARTLGSLSNQGQVWMVRHGTLSDPEVDCISATGLTTLTSDNPTDPRTLTCSGDLFIDQALCRAHLHGLTSQVTYSDSMGGFDADSMTIDYLPSSGTFTPTLITLAGNVHIRNHALGDQLSLQYALADQVDYDPSTETMTLSSLEAGRVLFLDSSQQTKISAPTVVIDRSQKRVEGHGPVRFTLSENEVAMLRNVFGIDD